MIDKPGIYDMSNDEYHADPCPVPSLSSSGARQILDECPARYWHDRTNPKPSTNVLDVGSLAHSVMLEGDAWRERFEVLPEGHNGRTNDGKALVASIEESGKTAIKHDDWQKVEAMVAALRAHKLANAAFSNGAPEKSLFWLDKEFGIWKRARLDILPANGRIFPDYKTCLSAHPEKLRRAMFNYGYHQQAAWYLDGIKALGIAERPAFLFVFQEKEPPHCVTIRQPDDTALMWARELNKRASAIFARCLQSGDWPGYDDDIGTLSLPDFAVNEYQRLDGMGLFDISAWFQSPNEEKAA